MTGKIFLNYRRADGGPWTVILRDKLIAHFGADRVFHDLSGVPLGARVRPYLAAQVADCAVMVTVIGPHWLTVLRERAAGAGPDHVLIEIEVALQQGKALIPVLAAGARMPTEADLPDTIRDLADCAGTTLGLERLDADVVTLIAGLERVLATVAAERPAVDSRVDRAAAEQVRVERERRAVEEARRQAEELSRRHDHDWQSAERDGTAAAYERFLASWTSGPHLEAAKRKLAVAHMNERQMAEQRAQEEQDRREGRIRVAVGPAGSDKLVALKPGESFRDLDPPVGPELVLVPPGRFWMGSNENEGSDRERPRHEVTIGYPLLVGKYPVTFAEWDAAEAAGGVTHKPGDEGWGRGRQPVINVSWDDAQAYTAWLSKVTGKSYRLLSESEWEYCCRAGTTTAYSFGDTITTARAQFLGGVSLSANQTVKVGSFPANAFGLHDMHGNVREWCEDHWHDTYAGAPADGSAWVSGGYKERRVLRGGSRLDSPQDLRSAGRFRNKTDGRYGFNGFRVARLVSR